MVAALAFVSSSLGATSAFAEDKRPEQDYGRPQPGTTPGDVIAWPARVVLFPLYVVNEFVFRRPLEAFVKVVEKDDLIEKVEDFFSFGPRKQVTILPSALFDFGLKPSVGFNFTWKYFLAEQNTLKVHVGTWGPSWVAIKASDGYAITKEETLGVDLAFVRRLDTPFFGLGPRSSQDSVTRYGLETFDVGPAFHLRFGAASHFDSSVGLRALEFFDGACCKPDPRLPEVLAQSPDPALRTPPVDAPGYGSGYVAGTQHVALALDSREAKPEPGSGVRIEGHETATLTVPQADRLQRSWIQYGGSLSGGVDLTGTQRVLSLTLSADFVDPLRGDIPFTDLVTIGGDDRMPGYLRNRLTDRSAAVATLQYTWPVWVYLDGVVHLAAGNVFGEHLDGIDPKLARLSTGIGVRSNGERDSGFEALFAVGTDPLDEGFQVTSFRLLIGSHHGF